VPQQRDTGATPVAFRVLGPIMAAVDGQPVDLGPPKRRLLLALLLLECGRPVPVDRLVDLAWEEPPPAARRVVFAHVARLRKALAGAERHGVALLSTPPGYTLRAAPEQVDAQLFRQLVAEAATLEDAAVRAKLLREALALWRGPALEDLAGGARAQRLARGLEDARLTALEDRIEADLAAGRHAGLVGELSELVDAHPLRERLVGHLMLALYRGGNASAALDAYRRARADLATELGLDPGPELAALHEAILRRDPTLGPATAGSAGVAEQPAAAPPLIAPPLAAPPVTAPAQLPTAPSGFTARTAEIRQLDALLDEAGHSGHPVITTIAGTAGVGKTSLAVYWAHRVADRFPDGQLYVNLRGFDPGGQVMDPAEAVRGFLDAFGVPADRVPAGVEAQTGLYRSLLAGKRVLVVLDNAATAEQVRPLLPGAAGCMAVVTSREQLTALVTTEGAQPLALDVLTVAEARQLLVARLGSARVAAEPQAVEVLIRLCARLPLALAIVAARAVTRPGFPLTALAGELSGDQIRPDARTRLDALDGGDAYTQIRAVFSWSYQRLSPAAARLFRLLGRHVGPDISVPAAASLAAVPATGVRPLLAELNRAHLLDEHGPGRHTFHDLLRAYATELAADTADGDEQRAARQRVLDHYLHTAYAASLLLNPHRQPITIDPPQPGVRPEPLADHAQALAWFSAERAVLVAAVRWAGETEFPAYAWQLAWTCTTFFERRGHWQELAMTQRAALTAARNGSDRVGQANAHYGLARAYFRLGRHEEAVTNFRSALDIFGELGDRTRQARTHLGIAGIRDLQGHARDALTQAEQALDIARAGTNKPLQANALNAVGWYHARLGDGRQALAYCQQALVLQQELGDYNGQATTWDSLGYAHHHLGEYARAVACYEHAVALYRDLGDRYYEADTLIHLGDSQHALGDVAAAQASWQDSVAILDELQHAAADTVRAKLLRPTEIR
jgi:DNA-binding SARP family transcriptional activator/tetratricopeptide (TPR) repeat protein